LITGLVQANVLIDDNGVAKLCDFGLARLIAESGDVATGTTTTTVHTGTVRYLAYEVVESDERPLPTRESDMHALGCLGLEVRFR
jgi:serine/threonine protein kinase